MAILYGMVWAGDYCIEGHGVLNVVLCCSILGLGMFDIIWFAVNHDGLCLKPLWRKSQAQHVSACLLWLGNHSRVHCHDLVWYHVSYEGTERAEDESVQNEHWSPRAPLSFTLQLAARANHTPTFLFSTPEFIPCNHFSMQVV